MTRLDARPWHPWLRINPRAPNDATRPMEPGGVASGARPSWVRGADQLVKRAVAAVLVAGLTACATQNQPGTTGYTAVPEAQFFGAVPVGGITTQDSARVIVKRDPGFTGAALSSVLLINGVRIVVIRPRQYLELSLAPDEYVFGVSWSDDLGALATSGTREIGGRRPESHSDARRLLRPLG